MNLEILKLEGWVSNNYFFVGKYLNKSDSRKAFEILSKSTPFIFPFFLAKSILSILIGIITLKKNTEE